MPYGTPWTNQEQEYLETYIGTKSLVSIAKTLKRPYFGVLGKVEKMNIANTKQQTGMLTVNELASALNIDWKVIDRWIKQYGLKAVKKRTRTTARFIFIDISEFWKWLYKHQDLYNSNRMEKNILGEEPEWFIEKRKRDAIEYPVKYQKYWTTKEINLLKTLWNSGKTVREIHEYMQHRSMSGIQRKLSRLIEQGELEKHKKGDFYTPKEEEIVIRLVKQGKTYEEIGKILGRSKSSVGHKILKLRASGVEI